MYDRLPTKVLMYTHIHVCKFLSNKKTWMWMFLVNTNGLERKSNLLFTFFVQMSIYYFYNTNNY